MHDELGGVAIDIEPAQDAIILKRGQHKEIDAVAFVFLTSNDVAIVDAAVLGLDGEIAGGRALPTAATLPIAPFRAKKQRQHDEHAAAEKQKHHELTDYFGVHVIILARSWCSLDVL